MKKTITLRGKCLYFSPTKTAHVPPGSFGVIYPAQGGFIITNRNGEEKLFIESDTTKTVCWFLLVKQKGKRRCFAPTTDEILVEFGMNRLSYGGVIKLATRIYQESILLQKI